MNNKEIREKLFELADQKYKEFSSSLCPGSDNMIGVRMPLIKDIAKELAKENVKKYLQNASDKYYEEIMLQGLTIGFAKQLNIDEVLEHLKNFIPKINSWGICDSLCSNLKITKKNMKKMWDFLTIYTNSKKEFELRFSLVMMLDYYLTEEYIDKVLENIKKINHEGYYVKMAAAWLIAEAYIKQKYKTKEFLKENKYKLDIFTYNKSLQKIIESNRIKEDEKQTIRKMKRK